MIPFLDFSGGNCQDARILEDDCAITVKLLGAWEGAKLWRNNQNIMNLLSVKAIYKFEAKY